MDIIDEVLLVKIGTMDHRLPFYYIRYYYDFFSDFSNVQFIQKVQG